MNKLTRWNPVRDLISINDAFNRLFDDVSLLPRNGEVWTTSPRIDMVEYDDDIVVKAELPGFKAEDVDVRVEGSLLTLRGQSSEETEKQEGHYHVRERRQSSFSRTITLPTDVDIDKANAEFENGILTLTLPKVEDARPKRINVVAKSTQ